MSRYPLLMLGLIAAGAFVVISTFAFGSGTSESIAFGVSIGTLVAGLGAQALVPAERRSRHRLLQAGIVGVSAWTILVALGIFGGATQTWLIFAGGVAVATAGLLANAAAVTPPRGAAASDPVAITSVKAA